jgi:hypothetical protein
VLERKYCTSWWYYITLSWLSTGTAIAGITASLLCSTEGYGWPLQSCK